MGGRSDGMGDASETIHEREKRIRTMNGRHVTFHGRLFWIEITRPGLDARDHGVLEGSGYRSAGLRRASRCPEGAGLEVLRAALRDVDPVALEAVAFRDDLGPKKIEQLPSKLSGQLVPLEDCDTISWVYDGTIIVQAFPESAQVTWDEPFRALGVSFSDVGLGGVPESAIAAALAHRLKKLGRPCDAVTALADGGTPRDSADLAGHNNRTLAAWLANRVSTSRPDLARKIIDHMLA